MTTREAIADLLRTEPDGLTAVEIAARLRLTDGQVRTSTRRCLEIYVDRWQTRSTQTGPYVVAVYCYTDTPQEDCPRPKIKPARQGSQAKVAA